MLRIALCSIETPRQPVLYGICLVVFERHGLPFGSVYACTLSRQYLLVTTTALFPSKVLLHRIFMYVLPVWLTQLQERLDIYRFKLQRSTVDQNDTDLLADHETQI